MDTVKFDNPPPALLQSDPMLLATIWTHHLNVTELGHAARRFLHSVVGVIRNREAAERLLELDGPTLTMIADVVAIGLIHLRGRGGRRKEDTVPASILQIFRTIFQFSWNPAPGQAVASTARTSHCSVYRTRVMDRDGCCIVTGLVPQCNIAHIVPHSVTGRPDRTTCPAWHAAVIIFSEPYANRIWDECTGGNYTSTKNGIRLLSTVHEAFDSGDLMLLPTDDSNGSRLLLRVLIPDSTRFQTATTRNDATELGPAHGVQYRALRHGEVLSMATDDPVMRPLPHPGLLKFRHHMNIVLLVVGLLEKRGGTQTEKGSRGDIEPGEQSEAENTLLNGEDVASFERDATTAVSSINSSSTAWPSSQAVVEEETPVDTSWIGQTWGRVEESGDEFCSECCDVCGEREPEDTSCQFEFQIHAQHREEGGSQCVE